MIEHCRRPPRARAGLGIRQTALVVVTILTAGIYMISGKTAVAQNVSVLFGAWQTANTLAPAGYQMQCVQRPILHSTFQYESTQRCRSRYGPVRLWQSGRWWVERGMLLLRATRWVPDRWTNGRPRPRPVTVFRILSVPNRNTVVMGHRRYPGRQFVYRRTR